MTVAGFHRRPTILDFMAAAIFLITLIVLTVARSSNEAWADEIRSNSPTAIFVLGVLMLVSRQSRTQTTPKKTKVSRIDTVLFYIFLGALFGLVSLLLDKELYFSPVFNWVAIVVLQFITFGLGFVLIARGRKATMVG